ncbi:MAG: sucrose phosphate synthase sucrose phosphatase-like protein [Ferruginibacter sp.]|uniref:HAD-IIB family hydrolase n=1 Tax=Ferruginibacter sp. TaxID=1940288 RepID=UPI00265813F5|nr:HAD-IIB family hydrolase [Ferruginibacter sp.]MDB5276985.1 sucrose phosphate synthase sucrose phosphatase-like protein [Ferruginibacter sp.]
MKEYYIQLYSPHGLIRFNDPEIGRDKDTGGQVKYVLEMLEHLSLHPQVRKVDLFTRKIIDKRVSSSYEKEVEVVNEKARIIRMACGGNMYRPKETLWDYLDEFIDKTIRFIDEEADFPDIVHGHYADGNYLAGQISEIFGIPFLATGHSLGRNKKNILLQEGMTEEKIEEKFNMARRIAVEENLLKAADVMVVSTQHIIDTQYALYDNVNTAEFKVIAPGVNDELFYPFYRLDMPSFKMSMEQEQALYRINSDIERFLFNPAKPLILSIGRADKRKNFEAIIQSYGQDKELQAMANLAIFAGVRKDISQMPDDEKDILTNLLLLLDKYDLYGKMAIPKKNDPKLEVPEIYRVAARKKGVFVNATPGENFGLTIVEAAACGLPIIASPTGGPKEILEQCDNGLLVDVEDPKAIAEALKKIISDSQVWEKYSTNGIVGANQLYSWTSYANKYIELLNELFQKKNTEEGSLSHKTAYGKKLANAELFIISDLDGTLVEGDDSKGLKEFTQWIADNKGKVVFGIASGRNRYITEQAFAQYDLPKPDILICSAGSEIFYTDKFIPDKGWESHINYQWKRKELQAALEKFPGIYLQEEAAQWRFKLSYYVDAHFDEDAMADLYKFLDDHKLRARVLLTDNKYLDLLPFRASKGSAVRYLSYKWKMPLEHFITAGNSGNDKDMLKGKAKGIVVSNYSAEMEDLKKYHSIYFTKNPMGTGVLEGIHHHIAKEQLLGSKN